MKRMLKSACIFAMALTCTTALGMSMSYTAQKQKEAYAKKMHAAQMAARKFSALREQMHSSDEEVESSSSSEEDQSLRALKHSLERIKVDRPALMAWYASQEAKLKKEQTTASVAQDNTYSTVEEEEGEYASMEEERFEEADQEINVNNLSLALLYNHLTSNSQGKGFEELNDEKVQELIKEYPEILLLEGFQKRLEKIKNRKEAILNFLRQTNDKKLASALEESPELAEMICIEDFCVNHTQSAELKAAFLKAISDGKLVNILDQNPELLVCTEIHSRLIKMEGTERFLPFIAYKATKERLYEIIEHKSQALDREEVKEAFLSSSSDIVTMYLQHLSVDTFLEIIQQNGKLLENSYVQERILNLRQSIKDMLAAGLEVAVEKRDRLSMLSEQLEKLSSQTVKSPKFLSECSDQEFAEAVMSHQELFSQDMVQERIITLDSRLRYTSMKVKLNEEGVKFIQDKAKEIYKLRNEVYQAELEARFRNKFPDIEVDNNFDISSIEQRSLPASEETEWEKEISVPRSSFRVKVVKLAYNRVGDYETNLTIGKSTGTASYPVYVAHKDGDLVDMPTYCIEQLQSGPARLGIDRYGRRWANILHPANKDALSVFLGIASNKDIITLCKNGSMLFAQPAAKKRFLEVFIKHEKREDITLLFKDDLVVQNLLKTTTDDELYDLLMNVQLGASLILNRHVQARCFKDKASIKKLQCLDESVLVDLLKSRTDLETLVQITHLKPSLLKQEWVCSRFLDQRNNLIPEFIKLTTGWAKYFVNAVYKTPACWENKAIQARVDEMLKDEKLFLDSIDRATLNWLANFIKLYYVESSSDAHSLMKSNNIDLYKVTQNFTTPDQWSNQIEISKLFDLAATYAKSGKANVQVKIDLEGGPVVGSMSVQEYTNTAQGVAVLATGLNKKGELEKVSTLLASTRFLKGVSIEIAKDAWQQIKDCPTAFIIGSAVALFPSSLAVPAFLALALYRTYCKKDAYIQTYQNFMDAIEKEKYEEAGRYAALLGIDILALKQLYPMLKNTKKIFFGNKNASKVIGEESQKSKSKLIPTIENFGKLLDSLDSRFVNKQQFKEAFEIFKNLPNILKDKDSPFSKIITLGRIDVGTKYLGNISGAWYEIETALKLHKAGETIKAFSVKILSQRYSRTRSFDILTEHKLIECKAWDWSKIIKSDWQKAFIEKLQIAKECNKVFEVHSKKPIPAEWKDFFNLKGINFCEGI